jgi:hypothetical protein
LSNDPSHLRDAIGRIGNEENHQRHDGGVEPSGIKWQRHCVALKKHGAARTRPHTRNRELRFMRIDALCLNWRAPLEDQFGESAGAAADVEPA